MKLARIYVFIFKLCPDWTRFEGIWLVCPSWRRLSIEVGKDLAELFGRSRESS
jgi:hypothetical protein